MSKSGLVVACLVCLIALLVGNFALHAVVSPSPIPDSYEAPRNPHFRRDWVRWTGAPEPLPGDRRIIVISNSQGFLRENAHGELCYSARLEAELSERLGERCEVLNWSIPGGKLPEMIVLAARAGAHDPTDIVLVTYTENFVGRSIRSPLSFSISDVPLLTGIPEVRSLLSPGFRRGFKVGNVSPYTGLHTGYGDLRWKTVEGTDEAWDWKIFEPTIAVKDLDKTVEPWDEDSSRMMREFVETAGRAAPDARVLVVAMPLARSAWTPDAWEELDRMRGNVAQATTGLAGVRALSAIDLVPDALFYTHTHMRAEGHEVFARWLAEQLVSRDRTAN